MTITVVVNGAKGRMGRCAVEAITADQSLELVGTLGREDSLKDALLKLKPDVVVDLTVAASAVENTKTIIEAGCRPVVGTSGFTFESVRTLQDLAQQKGLGGVIAPNFALGAVLMMKLAREIGQYLPNVEIVETHHEKKLDAPSGTSLRTAELIAESRGAKLLMASSPSISEEAIPGARGAAYCGIQIHSLRLPGHIAHQKVIFSGPGEVLTISHDSIDRDCFMPGICLACRKAPELAELLYGLEHIL
jgi:4-hydroxy-tetrahydrodipicolinate reductase